MVSSLSGRQKTEQTVCRKEMTRAAGSLFVSRMSKHFAAM